jgi:hypothetical protein
MQIQYCKYNKLEKTPNTTGLHQLITYIKSHPCRRVLLDDARLYYFSYFSFDTIPPMFWKITIGRFRVHNAQFKATMQRLRAKILEGSERSGSSMQWPTDRHRASCVRYHKQVFACQRLLERATDMFFTCSSDCQPDCLIWAPSLDRQISHFIYVISQ